MRRYLEVLALPGARTLLFSGIFGRLPVAMVPLALLLAVVAATDSYAAAGAATATYGISTAVVSPVLGRLADRHGPRPVLMVTGTTYPLAIGLLVVVLSVELPLPFVYVAASLAGLNMPLVSSSVRSLWPRLASGQRLSAAFALDSITVELLFVTGPMLVAVLAAAISPIAPLLLAAALCASASHWLARSAPARRWERPLRPEGRRDFFGPLAVAGIPRVLLTGSLFFAGVGAMDVALPAYADENGIPAMAGVFLALWAIGSASGGLWYGTLTTRRPLTTQYPIGLLLSGLGMVPLIFADNPWLLGALLVVAGVTLAPTMIVQNTMIVRIVPPHLTTEAFTWLTTVVFGASAVGAAVAGVVVDSYGVPATFAMGALVALAGAGLYTLLGLVGRPVSAAVVEETSARRTADAPTG